MSYVHEKVYVRPGGMSTKPWGCSWARLDLSPLMGYTFLVGPVLFKFNLIKAGEE